MKQDLIDEEDLEKMREAPATKYYFGILGT